MATVRYASPSITSISPSNGPSPPTGRSSLPCLARPSVRLCFRAVSRVDARVFIWSRAGSLTIYGSNFGTSRSNASVTLGGGDCVLTSLSDTRAICVIPWGQGANLPVVIASYGFASSDTPQSFSFDPPSIALMSPVNGPAAGGFNITVGGAVTWRWCLHLMGDAFLIGVHASILPRCHLFCSHVRGVFSLWMLMWWVAGANFGTGLPGAFNVSVCSCYVVDESDSAQVSYNGSWTFSSSYSGFYGFGYYVSSSSGSASSSQLSYAPQLYFTGLYEVAVSFPVRSGAATPNSASSSVVVSDANGVSTTVVIDQTANPSGWVSLGTFAMGAANLTQLRSVVSWRAPAGGTRPVVADAVRFCSVAAAQVSSPVQLSHPPQTAGAFSSLSTAVFSMPPGIGTASMVIFKVVSSTGVVAASVAVSAAAFFSYDAPRVTNVTGCGLDTPPSTSGCNVALPTPITIRGRNFGSLSVPGADAESVSAYVKDTAGQRLSALRCSNFSLVSDTEIRCAAPAVASGGNSVPVTVYAMGQSGAANLLSYAAPSLAAGTLRLCSSAVGAAVLNLADSAPGGMTSVCFSGSGFATQPAVYYGSASFSRRALGIASTDFQVTDPLAPAAMSPTNGVWFNCTVTAFTATAIACNLTEAFGSGYVFYVAVGILYSSPGTDVLNYPAPLIVPSTIRSSVTSSLGSSVYVSGSSQGSTVVFDAKNVPSYSAALFPFLVVYYAPPTSPSALVACSAVSIYGPSNSNYFYNTSAVNASAIRCKTSAGSGTKTLFVTRDLT